MLTVLDQGWGNSLVGLSVINVASGEVMFELNEETLDSLSINTAIADDQHLYTRDSSGQWIQHEVRSGAVLSEAPTPYRLPMRDSANGWLLTLEAPGNTA